MFGYGKQDVKSYYNSIPQIKAFEQETGAMFVGVIRNLCCCMTSVLYCNTNPRLHSCQNALTLPAGDYYCFAIGKCVKPSQNIENIETIYFIDLSCLTHFKDYSKTVINNLVTRDSFHMIGNLDALVDLRNCLNLSTSQESGEDILPFIDFCKNLHVRSVPEVMYDHYHVFDESLLKPKEVQVCQLIYRLEHDKSRYAVSCLRKEDCDALCFYLGETENLQLSLIRDKQRKYHGFILSTK